MLFTAQQETWIISARYQSLSVYSLSTWCSGMWPACPVLTLVHIVPIRDSAAQGKAALFGELELICWLLPLATCCHTPYDLHPFHVVLLKVKDLVVSNIQWTLTHNCTFSIHPASFAAKSSMKYIAATTVRDEACRHNTLDFYCIPDQSSVISSSLQPT